MAVRLIAPGKRGVQRHLEDFPLWRCTKCDRAWHWRLTPPPPDCGFCAYAAERRRELADALR